MKVLQKITYQFKFFNKTKLLSPNILSFKERRQISFDLTDEQKEFSNLALKFSKEVIIPNAKKWDEENIFPDDVHKQAWELGFYSVGIPEKYGGLGKHLMDICLINEQLSYGCTGFSTTLFVNELALAPLHLHGSEELKKKYFSRNASEPIVSAYAVTEPSTGSDVSGVKTYAKKNADGNWVLNGQKMWISNGGVANWYFVLAKTNMDVKCPQSKAFSGFIVEADSKGLSFGKKEKNMGQRSSDTRGVTFEDVIIPACNIVGEEGNGFKIAMGAFDMSRPVVAACATGLAQRCLDESTNYALSRKAFGKTIDNFQAVQFMLADMAVGIEASRLTYQRAAWEFDLGKKNTYYASVAKTLAADVANKCATDAVQVFGGAGFNKEYPVEKLMRDAKIFQIYEGTSQIQRVVVAREMLKQAKRSV